MIRQPKLDDLQDLNELSKNSWIEGFSDVLSEEDIKKAKDLHEFTTEESLRENIESDGSLSLVFEKNSKVVGKARLAWTEEETHDIVDVENNEVQLRSFYVHPDHWREGIASSLLQEIMGRAPDWADALKVETLRGSIAVDFYCKKGFEQVGSGTFSAEDVDIVESDYPTVILKKDLG